MPDKNYISKVKLPGDTKVYTIKDSEARDMITELMNYSHYLGVTTLTSSQMAAATSTTKIPIQYTEWTDTDGDGQQDTGEVTTTTIDWSAGNNYDATAHTFNAGCIVTASSDHTPYSKQDYVWNGTSWTVIGSVGDLKALAFKDSASGSYTPSVTGSKGTLAVASTTIAAADKPVTLSTTAITGATSFKAVNTPTSAKAAVTVSYDKATGGTASVSGNVELTGTIANGVTGVTGGTGTRSAASLALYTVTSGGQKIITDVTTNTTGTTFLTGVTVSSVTGGAATVGSATVYGLEGSTTTYMTTSETLSPVNATVFRAVSATTTVSAINASVAVTDEILTFTAVTPLSSITFSTYSVLSSTTTLTTGTQKTATKYTVGKSGATTFTQPTVTLSPTKGGITVTSSTYKVSVPANTLVTSVTAAAATTGDIPVTVSGSIELAGSITPTFTSTNATGTTDANVITALTTSTFYGKVNIPAHTHSHTLSGDIVVTPNAKTVTVS